MECIFCRILQGKIPGLKVFDRGSIFAILDIHPIAPGHTLVLPKDHHELFTDLPAALAAEFSQATQVVARAVIQAMKVEGYNLLINNHRCAGQAIPHVHVHVIPRRGGDGVRFNWDPKPYPEGEMVRVAESIRAAL